MSRTLWSAYFVFIIRLGFVMVLEMPGSCKIGEYFEPGMMLCQTCPGNASLVTSIDGFSCSCEDASVSIKPGLCKPCGPTAVVSADGTTCVPRRCQTTNGRTVCRRCPANYVSVTQNFDGSPMKEVLCVKCARGFKAIANACVRCAPCACAKNEMAVKDVCIPKTFVNARPKYDGLHPLALLDVMKNEYLCIQNDYKACRALASECVKNFYPSDAAGPCRLWLQRGLVQHKGLPPLVIESTNDKEPGIDLPRGMDSLKLALAVHTAAGGLKLLQYPNGVISPCFSAIAITIGKDFTQDCVYNVTELPLSAGDTVAPYLQMEGDMKPLPVALRKTSGSLIQRATWPSSNFRRYFVVHNSLTPSNSTATVYLKALLINLRMQRSRSSLRTHMTIEAQYATKPTYTRSITTTLKVQHEMPTTGVLRGLEVWGGVLGALMSCYALVQWRGVLRRGGLQVSLVPLLAGSIADAMYFAAWLSTLHALAAEAGSYGITMPPATVEEHIIRAFVFSSISLKAVKAAWVNWQQCRCDIFFLDWSEYNPPIKDALSGDDHNLWKIMTLAREWSAMQTVRRTHPGYTVALALVILRLLSPWQASLPHSPSYTWAVGTLAWWAAYASVLLSRWVWDRVVGSPALGIARVCDGVGMSLLVFQEEYYAHYVHGRNNGSPDAKTMSGPLEACRVVCAPQLRAVYKRLAVPGMGAMDEQETSQALLSRFLAAFFERALDGLSWVASERTVLERLLDTELVAREAGNTSALLYDPDNTPSCYAVCWWGEEWTLATLDAMLFGCILLVTRDCLAAVLVTLAVWQVAKLLRTWSGDRNLKQHIGIEAIL